MENRSKLGQELYELGLRLGTLGAVAIGSGGGPLAKTLARAAGCGVSLAGGEARFHDGGCAACGAWVGQHYDLPAALFVRQDGDEVEIYLTDDQGRRFQRRLDAGGPGGAVGGWDLLAGADCAWAADRVGDRRVPGGLVWAVGPAALTLALERLGYEVSDRPVSGAAAFRADREGLTLTVEQDGLALRPVGEDALEAAACFTQAPRAVSAFRPGEGGGAQESPKPV